MNLFIDNRSQEPIYSQIYSSLRSQIISGALKANEALPSIRSLAKDLRISVITTKRAYEELEKDGYIYTIAGKGCFVAEMNPQLIKEEHMRSIEALFEEACELGAAAGISSEELDGMWKTILEESK
ncbi:MAG: GntR family transcriptional regulator [Solobacterium sp.]|nr:GntR family transcriptional regulator [Solobacterium sp.]